MQQTVVVCGLSPHSFSSEILQLWHQTASKPLTHLVWFNKFDLAPRLPDGQHWDEVHYEDVENIENASKSWGNMLLIIGAGVSYGLTDVDFVCMKKASKGLVPYSFDREALLHSLEIGVSMDSDGKIAEPLCVQSFRLMAKLHETYLARKLSVFHDWMKRSRSRIFGVITLNIDSLESIALSDSNPQIPILQLHGNVLQLISISELSLPYTSRSIVHRSGWSDINEVHNIACGQSSLADIIHFSNLKQESNAQILHISRDLVQNGFRRSKRLVNEKIKMEQVCLNVCSAKDISNIECKISFDSCNYYMKKLLTQICIGHLVYNGDEGCAYIATEARFLLKNFFCSVCHPFVEIQSKKRCLYRCMCHNDRCINKKRKLSKSL